MSSGDRGATSILRDAWNNGVGFGTDREADNDGPDQAVSDAAFATWLNEHKGEIEHMIIGLAGAGAAVERARLAGLVRGLQGPLAWRRFRMKHRAVAERGTAALVRALADEIASGWES